MQRELRLEPGARISEADPILFSCGPLRMAFEPASGWLRDVRVGDREVVRAIYVAVRDQNWNTVPPRLSELAIQDTADGLRFTFAVRCRQDAIDFAWRGAITCDRVGRLQFEMSGIAHSEFLRNRIGLCVLHPAGECAGRPCRVTHSDGRAENTAFPDLIAPHQPFRDVRAVAHTVFPGLEAEVRFDGDVFEMEDQRNWTDASFKTYCTPLALPFPVRVPAGAQIAQTITLTLRQTGPQTAASLEGSAPEIGIRMTGAAPMPLPRIGLGATDHPFPLTPGEQSLLARLGLCHLRVDLDLTSKDWPQILERAAADAGALNVGLLAALMLSDQAETELSALSAHCAQLHPPIRDWLIFHGSEKSTSGRWIQLARARLTACAPLARFGAGTNAYFAEINRARPSASLLDLACYSLNPQVHAFDTRTLVENLEAQAETVRSARAFLGALPILISPITLCPRHNPDATSAPQVPAADSLPPDVDPRQMSLFGAGWTLGSLKCLCECGVDALTYYETTGWRGVMESGRAVSGPVPSPSLPVAVFPLYHVFADFGEYAGGCIVPCVSDAPLSATAVVLEKEGQMCLLCANLTASTQALRAQAPGGERVTLRLLDERSVEDAMRSPGRFRARMEPLQTQGGAFTMDLPPFAYARLDFMQAGD